MYLSCIVSEIQRDVSRKSPIWTYPTSIWHPRRGWRLWNFAEIFGIRVTGLSYGVVCMILHLAILAQWRLVTDRQTDTLTHDDSIWHTSIASHGKTLKKSLTGPQPVLICHWLIQKGMPRWLFNGLIKFQCHNNTLMNKMFSSNKNKVSINRQNK